LVAASEPYAELHRQDDGHIAFTDVFHVEGKFRLADEPPAGYEHVVGVDPGSPDVTATFTAEFNGDGSWTVVDEVAPAPTAELVEAVKRIGLPPPGTKVSVWSNPPHPGSVEKWLTPYPGAQSIPVMTDPAMERDQWRLASEVAVEVAERLKAAFAVPEALRVLSPPAALSAGYDWGAEDPAVYAFRYMSLAVAPPSRFVGIENVDAPPAPPPKAHRFDDPYCAGEMGRLCVDCGAGYARYSTRPVCVPRPGWREEHERAVYALTFGADYKAAEREAPPRFAPPEPSLSGLGAVACRMVGTRR
jgi:hypothetical protein